MTEQQIGIVYKVVPKDENGLEVYVGSTITTLNHRLAGHKADFNRWWANKHHWVSIFHIFLMYGIDQVDIIEIELYPVDQLKQREQLWIEEISTVDQYRAFITEKQRQEQKNHQTKHSCECGGRYTTSHKKEHMNSAKHQAFLSNQISPTVNTTQ